MPLTDYTLDSLNKAEQAFAVSRGLPADSLDAVHKHREKQTQELPSVWHRVAVWIVAPVLAGYAGWMAQQAKLYDHSLFLGVMREGRMLSRLMQSLFNIPAQEIWLNRNLSMRAAFGCGDDEALVNWLVRTRVKPLTCAEAIKDLTGNTRNALDADKSIDLGNVYQLIEKWKQNGQLEQMRNEARNIANRLSRHWQNTLGATKGPALLMDFACAGNIQRSLQTVLNFNQDKTSVIGLNFAMTAGSQWAEKAGCRMEGYLSERGKPQWFADAYARTPELMEIFTAAPLGSLKGYTEQGEPVFGTTFLSETQKQLVQDLQDQILTAADSYYRALGDKLTADLCRCLWGRLLLEPLAAEAQTLADWPLDAGLDGGERHVLAAKLQGPPETWTKIQTAWPAASQLLSCEN